MQDELMVRLETEARDVYAWSNAAGYRYAAHRHGYAKILYCVEGSIDFSLVADRRVLHLEPGDRMELPAGTEHDAVVGPRGVTCIEGKKR